MVGRRIFSASSSFGSTDPATINTNSHDHSSGLVLTAIATATTTTNICNKIDNSDKLTSHMSSFAPSSNYGSYSSSSPACCSSVVCCCSGSFACCCGPSCICTTCNCRVLYNSYNPEPLVDYCKSLPKLVFTPNNEQSSGHSNQFWFKHWFKSTGVADKPLELSLASSIMDYSLLATTPFGIVESGACPTPSGVVESGAFSLACPTPFGVVESGAFSLACPTRFGASCDITASHTLRAVNSGRVEKSRTRGKSCVLRLISRHFLKKTPPPPSSFPLVDRGDSFCLAPSFPEEMDMDLVSPVVGDETVLSVGKMEVNNLSIEAMEDVEFNVPLVSMEEINDLCHGLASMMIDSQPFPVDEDSDGEDKVPAAVAVSSALPVITPPIPSNYMHAATTPSAPSQSLPIIMPMPTPPTIPSSTPSVPSSSTIPLVPSSSTIPLVSNKKKSSDAALAALFDKFEKEGKNLFAELIIIYIYCLLNAV